jgi:hypothetical protein
MSQKLPYREILQKLDKLRKQGLKDSDLEIMKLKAQLRDYLDDRKKESKKTKSVVPKLTSIKTLKLDLPEDKDTDTTLKKITGLGDIKKEHLAKYALMGILLAVGALAYHWYKDSR